jgi:hypothetical protein
MLGIDSSPEVSIIEINSELLPFIFLLLPSRLVVFLLLIASSPFFPLASPTFF